MELFLNILWVVIVLAAFAVWRGVWSREKRDGRHAWLHEWTAFACTLIFLFFAVSLTDDLHANLDFLVESSASRRSALISACAHSQHHAESVVPDLYATIFPHVRLHNPLCFVAIVLPFDLPSNAFIEGGLSSGRAPPVLL